MQILKKQFAQAELNVIYKQAAYPTIIKNGNDAFSYFLSIWDQEIINVQEQVYVLFVNRANEVICWRCLHTGTTNTSQVDVKLIFAFAFGCLASGFIIAHNHPSGYVNPSTADYELTKNLYNAAKILGFKFLDHLVISNHQYYSFLSKTRVG